jgi:DNA-binding beta-propeller fold protein YncE
MMLRERRVTMKRTLAGLALVVALASAAHTQTAAPRFDVDPAWPKPLPNNWIVGEVAGIAVDAQDHVWVLQRSRTVGVVARGAAPPVPPPTGVAAPPVIELDTSGNFLQAWGGPGTGYEWPANEHGLSVDSKNNLWVTGGGARDAHVLKFTSAGKFVLQIGHQGQVGNNADTTTLDRPTDAVVDPAVNEVYITDGEVGGSHHRVMVFDADSGAFKRLWGAYGEKPEDMPPQPARGGAAPPVPAVPIDPNAPPSRQFGTATHCVRIARDGLVYICDRSNNRIQVFRKDGTFVKEAFVERTTAGLGAIWDLELSPDQRFLYIADGQNQKIWILQRDSLQILGSFGSDGHAPGQIRGANAIAVDSKGNIYIAEAADGRRVQKFTFKGM